MREFGRWRDRAIEREIKRNEVWIARGRIYRTWLKLDRWRCWEVSSKLSGQVSRIWPSTDTGVEQVSRYKNIRHKRWGLINPPGVEKLLRGQELSRSIHQESRRCRDCDKKKLGSSTNKPGIERCRAAVKLSICRCWKVSSRYRAICQALMNSFFLLVS